MILMLPKRKIKTLADHFNDFIAWFLGSWWAVVFHALWFTVWLIFNFDINILTLGVSLEAIFIGIFLLMAANKAEVKRDMRDLRLRREDKKRMELDIKLDQKEERHLQKIDQELEEIKAQLTRLEKAIKN